MSLNSMLIGQGNVKLPLCLQTSEPPGGEPCKQILIEMPARCPVTARDCLSYSPFGLPLEEVESFFLAVLFRTACLPWLSQCVLCSGLLVEVGILPATSCF